MGDQREKALSLPLNLSHSKDKDFFSLSPFKSSDSFYDKLSLQFNLGFQSLGAENSQVGGEKKVLYPDRHAGEAARSANSGRRKRPGWREVQ